MSDASPHRPRPAARIRDDLPEERHQRRHVRVEAELLALRPHARAQYVHARSVPQVRRQRVDVVIKDGRSGVARAIVHDHGLPRVQRPGLQACQRAGDEVHLFESRHQHAHAGLGRRRRHATSIRRHGPTRLRHVSRARAPVRHGNVFRKTTFQTCATTACKQYCITLW
jgi:hypothetical protein